MKCPSEELLMAFLDGEVGVRKHDAISLHVRGCVSCGERMKELKTLKGLVREEEREVVSAADVAEFVASLPDGGRRAAGVWRRLVLVPGLAAALLAGAFVGWAFRPAPAVIEIHERAALEAEQAVPALTALQRLKLAGSGDVFAAEIRGVEELLCDSVSEDAAGVVRAVRLIEQGEDSLAGEDSMRAVVFFAVAAKAAEGSEIGNHARLRHARVLADNLGLYGDATAKLVELRDNTKDEALLREAAYLFAEWQIEMGDTWQAGLTLEHLAREEGPNERLAEIAARLGDLTYEETLDLETAQRAYEVWRDSRLGTEGIVREFKAISKRLALLEESSDDRWEPLLLYLRAESAHPYEAQRLYGDVVAEYPDSSLADSAFVKWYGFEQSRSVRERFGGEAPEPRRSGQADIWEAVAESDAREEIRAYARLKIADRLDVALDGVDEVLLAYKKVEKEFAWSPAARIAGEKADRVSESIHKKELEF